MIVVFVLAAVVFIGISIYCKVKEPDAIRNRDSKSRRPQSVSLRSPRTNSTIIKTLLGNLPPKLHTQELCPQ